MKCKICNSETNNIFSSKILNKYNINYYYCENCNFLQTEEPYWLKESYESSINITDTGILQRNIYLSKIVSILIYFFFNQNGKFLDYAGGYGIFTRLMRDIGFDFYWYDPFSENLVSRGFEYNNNDKIELITSFESFEHFDKPLLYIENMLKISTNIIFTTKILPNPVPDPEEWWYYGLEHGQHISFYSIETLKYIADLYNLYFYSDYSDIHIFTKENLSLNKVYEFKNKYIKNKLNLLFDFLKYIIDKIDLHYLINELKNTKINYDLKNKKDLNYIILYFIKNNELLFDIVIKDNLKSRTFKDMMMLKKNI